MYEFQNWRVWRNVTSDDTWLTNLKNANRPALSDDRMIKVKHASVILVRVFGTDAANEDCDFRITGFMENGPGDVLLRSTVTLGTTSVDEPPVLAKDRNPWSTGTTYLEADAFTIAGNSCEAYVGKTADNLTSHLVLHTMEHPYLMLEVDLDGGSSTSSSMGFIWRELAVGV